MQKGIYKIVIRTGAAVEVYIEDSSGISVTIPAHDYVARGLFPSIDELPSQYDYQKTFPGS